MLAGGTLCCRLAEFEVNCEFGGHALKDSAKLKLEKLGDLESSVAAVSKYLGNGVD